MLSLLSSAGGWLFCFFDLTITVFSPLAYFLYWVTIILSPAFNSSPNVADQLPFSSTTASLLMLVPGLFFNSTIKPTLCPGAAVPLIILSPSYTSFTVNFACSSFSRASSSSCEGGSCWGFLFWSGFCCGLFSFFFASTTVFICLEISFSSSCWTTRTTSPFFNSIPFGTFKIHLPFLSTSIFSPMIRPWGLVTWIFAPAFPVPVIVASPSVTGFIVGVCDLSFSISFSWFSGLLFSVSGFFSTSGFVFSVSKLFLSLTILIAVAFSLFPSYWVTLMISPFSNSSSCVNETFHTPLLSTEVPAWNFLPVFVDVTDSSTLLPGLPLPEMTLSPTFDSFIVISFFSCGVCFSVSGFLFAVSVTNVNVVVDVFPGSVWIAFTLYPFLSEFWSTVTSHVPSSFTVVSPAVSQSSCFFSISTSILEPFTPVPLILVWPSITWLIIGAFEAFWLFLTVMLAVTTAVDWSLYFTVTVTLIFFSLSIFSNSEASGV